MTLREITSVRQSVRAALGKHQRVVLAVSGGLDSMVLLDAAASSVPRERLVVATFDHATGTPAAAAAALVARRAEALALECVSERAVGELHGEAELRDARWTFLRRVAEERAAVVATAHTLDDQIETVLMRVLRAAGARGLAALYAEGDVARPLLRFPRRDLARYARNEGLVWVEDPSNATPVYLRNRVRHDLLPALRRVRPGIDDELLKIARKAAKWRSDLDAHVDARIAVRQRPRGADVDAAALRSHPVAELQVLWPAIAARAGVVLDRRGTERLAAFTHQGGVGARMQLAGGWQVVRSREAFQIRPDESPAEDATSLVAGEAIRWGAWHFASVSTAGDDDDWSAVLPDDRPLTVRPWAPGDTMQLNEGRAPTKVKHLLTDGGLTGHERAGWPVVLAGDQIVWIPGIRRSFAAAARSGRPGLPFACEYVNC
ncbi:MAG TPA: tRNA lysidine(34) synthetase TilS [Gemmatimonadaceae bacterium]|nr:tRNA lysidine(34) synthetase TilS [Gemmatimonadaceae bacterium]